MAKNYNKTLTLSELSLDPVKWDRVQFKQPEWMQITQMYFHILRELNHKLSLQKPHLEGLQCQVRSLLQSFKIRPWCNKTFMALMGQDNRTDSKSTRQTLMMWEDGQNLKWMSYTSKVGQLHRELKNPQMHHHCKEEYLVKRMSNKMLTKMSTKRSPVCNKRAPFLMRTLQCLFRKTLENKCLLSLITPARWEKSCQAITLTMMVMLNLHQKRSNQPMVMDKGKLCEHFK